MCDDLDVDQNLRRRNKIFFANFVLYDEIFGEKTKDLSKNLLHFSDFCDIMKI